MKREIRKPHPIEAFSTIVLLLALIVVGIQYSVNSVPMLIIATVWCLIVGFRCGFPYSELMKAILERLSGLMEVLLIIFSIGVFIAAMMYSGTIPTLIYYLVGIINPNFMIVLSFVISGLVAVMIGTSWGTAGTVGIVMISIASTMGISMPMVAGAVISGAHVGQLLSPMSDTTNVGANLAEVDTGSMIKRISYFSVPVVVLSIVAYTVLGFVGGAGSANLETSVMIRNEISAVFNTNPIVILPMVLVFVLTFMKKPIVMTLIIAALTAIVFGAVFNGYPMAAGLEALYSGFNLQTVTGQDPAGFSNIFLNLVNRGGMVSMVSSALLAIVATCYGAVMTKIKAVDVIATLIFSKVKSRVGLVISSVLVATIVVALTTSAYLAVLMVNDLFKAKFHENGMDNKDLIASCMSASTQVVTCVPWVDTAIYLATITGVATLTSLPFNFFCWGNAVMVIIMAIFGIGFANGKRLKEKVKAAV